MERPGIHGSIVDSHQHFWDIARFTYRWMPRGRSVLRRTYLPDNLAPELQSSGVSHTILVEAHDSMEETQFLLKLADQHEWIAGVVGWVDLADPHLGRVLETLRRRSKLVGVRHQVESETDDAWLLRPSVLRGLRELAAAGLSFDLVVYPRHLRCIPEVADKVPGLRMALDHLGKPPIALSRMEPWTADISKAAHVPGLVCKISGMATEADPARWSANEVRPYVQHVVREFGLQRLMWGSDWPVCLKAGSYGRIMELARETVGALDPDAEKAFWAGTARSFYRLLA